MKGKCSLVIIFIKTGRDNIFTKLLLAVNIMSAADKTWHETENSHYVRIVNEFKAQNSGEYEI